MTKVIRFMPKGYNEHIQTVLRILLTSSMLGSLYAMEQEPKIDKKAEIPAALEIATKAVQEEEPKIQLALPPEGREADITHLLQQEHNNILTLNRAAVERGLPEVCSWPQLRQLTFMLSKASLHQVPAIDFKDSDLTEDLPTIPKNPMLKKLWKDNNFQYYEGDYWLPALWATAASLKNVQPSQEATEVPVHLHTLLAFFDFFAPVSVTRCEELATTDPHVATYYTGVCFKRLYDLVQLTEWYKKSHKRKYSDPDGTGRWEEQRKKAEPHMAKMFPCPNDYLIREYTKVSTNVPLEEHKIEEPKNLESTCSLS